MSVFSSTLEFREDSLVRLSEKLAKIFTPTPYDPETGTGGTLLPATEEGLLIWGQLFSL